MYRTRHWGAMYYLMHSCIRTERVHCTVHFSRVFWKNKFRVAINVFLHLPADCRALFLCCSSSVFFRPLLLTHVRRRYLNSFSFFLLPVARSMIMAASIIQEEEERERGRNSPLFPLLQHHKKRIPIWPPCVNVRQDVKIRFFFSPCILREKKTVAAHHQVPQLFSDSKFCTGLAA